MSSPVSANTELNDCGCCEGISVETPSAVSNRPGLSAIAYRVGTHAQFKETLLARLSGSNQPALRSLTTRDDDDFSIALLDAWATVGDVLTFYQERIANEAYLRTATERLSVLELARLIDYQLRPGVAASTYLAFTIEDAPGALGQALSVGTTAQIAAPTLPPITVPVGVKVQSIPGPDEQAQMFETVEEIEARPEWNAIRPRLTQPQTISTSMETVIFEGALNNLKLGDRLLIVDSNGNAIKTILHLTINDEEQTTRVDFATDPPSLPDYKRPQALESGGLSDFKVKGGLTQSKSQEIIAKKWSEEDLTAIAQMQGWSISELTANITQQTVQPEFLEDAGIFAFRQQASFFGHNAPYYGSLLKANGNNLYPHDWDSSGFEIWKDSLTNGYYADADVYLERNLSGVIKDTWIILELSTTGGTTRTPYIITEVKEASLAGFGISGKSTGLQLAKDDGTALADNATDKPADFKVRKTTALVESEELPLTELPIETPLEPVAVAADGLTLDGIYFGLKLGQRIIITGERNDLKGVLASETLTLKEVIIEAGFTVVKFEESLAYSYVRQTVSINANVALATHGETVGETLGGGDATQEFQRFVLRQPPVTYVSSSDPSGGETTLEVRVNDLLWHEVPNFYGHGPDERIYVTRLDDEGKTTVIFGDGKTGARLPSGQENVKAVYRKGIGLPGLVKANQLTMLMTRPLGVKGVTNPNAAAGAADREQLADARRNAPLTVLTLGRIVSLRDYEDFASAFSGIGKALATWTWFGEKQGVFVTIAGAGGAEVEEDSKLGVNLMTAMRESGDPRVPLQIKTYQPRFFRLSATLSIHPDYLSEIVLAAVEQKLRDTYSFEARAFGQPVHLSEVIGVMQNVEGVVAVDVDEFYLSNEAVDRHLRLAAAYPLPGDDEVFPAELLTLDPRPLKLGVMP
jgi:hypothetical protein